MKKYTMLIVLALAIIVLSAMFGGSMNGTANAAGVLDDNSLLKTRYNVTATPRQLNYCVGVTSAIQTQLDAKTTGSLADTKIFIGTSSGVGIAQTVSGDFSITNAGVGSIEAGTDAQMLIYNATDGWAPDTISGDFSINNTGVGALNANVVGASQAYTNTVTLVIAAGANSNSVSVWAGSALIDTQPVSGLTNNVSLDQTTYDNVNGVWYIGTDSNAGAAAPVVLNGVFFNPN